MIDINLTYEECQQAAQLGCIRRLSSIAEGMKDMAGRPNDWTADIEGAAGEMAFARWIGQYFLPTNKTFSLPDVGKYEVKLSTKPGDLPVRLDTPDNQVVVLVTGVIPKFKIVGWITGLEAKKVPPTQRLYYPVHWVPTWMLNSPQSLKEGKAYQPPAPIKDPALS